MHWQSAPAYGRQTGKEEHLHLVDTETVREASLKTEFTAICGICNPVSWSVGGTEERGCGWVCGEGCWLVLIRSIFSKHSVSVLVSGPVGPEGRSGPLSSGHHTETHRCTCSWPPQLHDPSGEPWINPHTHPRLLAFTPRTFLKPRLDHSALELSILCHLLFKYLDALAFSEWSSRANRRHLGC